MHPYELDVNEPAELRSRGHRIPFKTYFKQTLFRGRIAGRLNHLLTEFRFAPMADILNLN